MTSQSRKHRGYKSQSILAEYLKINGWPFAESVGAGRSGTDITGTPCLDWEVKARSGFDPAGTMKQLSARAKEGEIPIAVLRLNGQGEASINDWCTIVPLSVMVQILREAGYGSDT
jgi:hypothetical protein